MSALPNNADHAEEFGPQTAGGQPKSKPSSPRDAGALTNMDAPAKSEEPQTLWAAVEGALGLMVAGTVKVVLFSGIALLAVVLALMLRVIFRPLEAWGADDPVLRYWLKAWEHGLIAADLWSFGLYLARLLQMELSSFFVFLVGCFKTTAVKL